jgi:ssDNA-binding Zn-finger/Zn-ribbon topoisomerase 1
MALNCPKCKMELKPSVNGGKCPKCSPATGTVQASNTKNVTVNGSSNVNGAVGISSSGPM